MSQTNRVHPYAAAGVDLSVSRVFSSYVGKICREAQNNSPFVEPRKPKNDHHRASRGWRLKNTPDNYFNVAGMDGNGTKPILNVAANAIPDAAEDLCAMLKTDISRHGGKALIWLNQLDVNSLGAADSQLFSDYLHLMDNMAAVAKREELYLGGGETAELRDTVTRVILLDGKAAFNWCGCMIGINHDDLEIDGSEVRAGNVILGFREKVFRANGVSAVRREFARQFGERWWENPAAAEAMRIAATPSVSYDRFLNRLNGWDSPVFTPIVKANLIVHNTGGGIHEKLAEPLWDLGYSARLDKLRDPIPLMKQVVSGQGMTDEEAYETLNGGYGLFMVVHAHRVIQEAKADGLEVDHVGEVLETPPSGKYVEVHSRYTGREFAYTPKPAATA